MIVSRLDKKTIIADRFISKKQKCQIISKPFNFGFTLAETLIVLGIIGIVAELTIPTLFKSIQDQIYKTAYKKAYSVAYQALTSANQQNLLVATTSEGDTNNINNFLTWMAQFKTIKQCTNNDYQNCWDDSGEKYGLGWNPTGFPQHGNSTYAFMDASGMAWTMYYWGIFTIFVDTNGFKKPNQYGKDRFVFYMMDINGNYNSGTPVKVVPDSDNSSVICHSPNKCTTEMNYYATSWLYN